MINKDSAESIEYRKSIRQNYLNEKRLELLENRLNIDEIYNMIAYWQDRGETWTQWNARS